MVAQRKPAARDIAPLEAASRAMDAALKADDLDAWAQADERFHRHLVELCGNRLLAATVYNFWDRAHRARMFTLRLRPKPVHSTREHTDLVRAIRKGDAAAAREIHRAHRERGTPRAHLHPRALQARANVTTADHGQDNLRHLRAAGRRHRHRSDRGGAAAP